MDLEKQRMLEKREKLMEWYSLLDPEQQKKEARHRSPCCRDYYGGREKGMTETGVKHVVECSNCGKVYRETPKKTGQDQEYIEAPDRSDQIIGEGEPKIKSWFTEGRERNEPDTTPEDTVPF